MKNKSKLIVFFYGLLMMSCVVYYPQTEDIPLIKEKKDLRIDAGVSSHISANATVSYGLTKNIAVQAYGNIMHGQYFQAAMGYYKDLGNKTVFENYYGYGRGFGNAYWSATGGHLYGNYNLYFTQLNWGKVDCNFANCDFGFGVKLGYLHSELTDENYYHNYYDDRFPYRQYTDKSFLIEPKLFIRLGGEHLKFNLKVGSSWIYKFTHQDKELPYSFINIGLGLNYNF